MGRPPCCDKANVKKGPWTPEEDAKLLAYTSNHGTGNWTSVPHRAGLKRCGKSCRLRYTNYLRPNLKHENFTQEEEDLIVTLHAMLGSRWSLIANQLPGRTDNDVKNYWNTKLSKKLKQRGIDPITHRPIADLMQSMGTLVHPPSTVAGASSSSSYHPVEAPAFHDDLSYHAALQQQQQQQVIRLLDADAPGAAASPDHQLKWSDFLADDAAGLEATPQVVLGQYQETKLAGGGACVYGDIESTAADVRGGGEDSTGSAFIDAMLDSDKEMGVDQLIADLLADPAYYGGGGSSSTSGMGWGC